MAGTNSRRGDLATCSSELISSIRLWSVKRRETVQTLRNLADELLEHHKNVHIAKVSGSSASIAGFVLLATGFGLAPVTLGTSVILSAVGGAICAGGGATAAGSSIVEMKIFKTKLAAVQEIIDADRKAQEPVEELLDDLYRQVSRLSLSGMKDALSYNASVISLVKNLVDVGKSVKAGARMASTAAGEGAEAVLRSIGIAGNVARIGIFAVSVAFLPVDIWTLVNSSMAIDSARKGKRDKEPETVKKLRDLADTLEKEMHEILQVVDDFRQR